jgi:putative endonuclease
MTLRFTVGAALQREYRFYVYIMASTSRVIYVGMTNGPEKRVWQHKNDLVAGFTKRYKCHRLVHYESFDDVRKAINREKELKGWSRAKKVALIEKINPLWDDLAADWYTHHRYEPPENIQEPVAPIYSRNLATPQQCHSEERSDEESAVCSRRRKADPSLCSG